MIIYVLALIFIAKYGQLLIILLCLVEYSEFEKHYKIKGKSYGDSIPFNRKYKPNMIQFSTKLYKPNQ